SLTTVVVLGAAVWVMAQTGLFDALSLAHEYRARRDLFGGAILRHIELVAAAVVPALLIGVPLGVAAARRLRLQGPRLAGLHLQTIPSIARLGLLIGRLSAVANAVPALAALGIAGIGPAPAIIALILYALLPVVRNTTAGIAGVEPAIVDAACGVGMTQRQL